MGEKDNKISTIVLKVDLECKRCYRKIRKTLCKIQDKMDIKSISYDEKGNTVTISGPFDADKVCKKLYCKAGRVIKDMTIKGKDGGGDKPAAAKPAENKDAGKAEKAKDDKADKGGKAESKDAKPAAAGEKKEAKADKGGDDKDGKGDKAEKPKDANPEKKKVTFEDAKAIPKADIGPLLAKIAAAKAAGPAPPCGEPIAAPPPAAQGVAVASIWPAPASSVAGYSYNPSYDPSYYGGGYNAGYGGCGCGYAPGYCRCGKPAAAPAGGGYYGVPVYDHQGWYYGGGGARQPAYYPQQQASYYGEDPNAGCSVM